MEIMAETRLDRFNKASWFLSKSPFYALKIETTKNDFLVVKIYPKKDDKVNFTNPVFLGKLKENNTFNFLGIQFLFEPGEREGRLTIVGSREKSSEPHTPNDISNDDIPF